MKKINLEKKEKDFRKLSKKTFSVENQKNTWLVFASLAVIIVIVSFTIVLTSKNDPEPIITPLSKERAQAPQQDQPSIQKATYYINISQRFLTKAEELSKNLNQSPKDKEDILIAVQNSLETINEGISHYPKDDRLYAQRAKIYQGIASFSSDALEAALADLDQARKLSPQNPTYPKNQSQILARLGRYQDASFYAKIAYEIEPHNLQNLADLGQIQIKAGQIKQAVSSYQSLVSLLPQDSQERATVKQEIASLEKLLTQAKTNPSSELFLASEPTPKNPEPKNVPADINLLPQEQASLPENLVIAGPQEENGHQQDQELDLNAFAGEAIIAAQETETTIYNHNLTDNKKINLVPQEEMSNQILYVKSKNTNPNDGAPYFIVSLSQPLSQDLAFKWWIIE
jgi:tetratricopeptide (TPR) repeat protein